MIRIEGGHCCTRCLPTEQRKCSPAIGTGELFNLRFVQIVAAGHLLRWSCAVTELKAQGLPHGCMTNLDRPFRFFDLLLNGFSWFACRQLSVCGMDQGNSLF